MNGFCVKDCREGTYYDYYYDKCFECDDHCSSCDLDYYSYLSNCSDCEEGFELKNGMCQKKCPSGKYYNYDKEKCRSCPSTCSECYYDFYFLEAVCLECSADSFFDY